MSKVYPSNLTARQYDLLKDEIPGPKPRGRPREVDMWDILNAIFYLLVEGCQWRALPGDFPPIALRAFQKGKRFTPMFATGANTERKSYDRLR